jgi:hypothetical protein
VEKIKMKTSIEKALQEITNEWLNIEGVNGVGQGKTGKEDCIIVTLDAKTPEIEKKIPKEYKGFSVKLLVTGPIFAETSKKPK